MSRRYVFSPHHHCTHSYGDGFGTPLEHAQRAAELGFEVMALTDHGNVSAHHQFEKAATKIGIKPVYGCELYCGKTGIDPCVNCDGTGHVMRPKEFVLPADPEEVGTLELDFGDVKVNGVVTREAEDRVVEHEVPTPCSVCNGKGGISERTQWKNHLTVLAKNREGYQNLNRIVSQSWTDFHYHPTASGETLQKHRNGLIVLSGCAGSLLACTLLGGKGTEEHNDRPDYDAAIAVAERFSRMWGDDYYLEIQPFYELPRTLAINQAYVIIGHELGIPLVVTCDVHYPRMEDAEMQAVLHASHRGNQTVDDAMRSWNYDVPLTLPETDDELASRLVKTGLDRTAAWDAITITQEIADKCIVELPKAKRLRYTITDKDLQPWT